MTELDALIEFEMALAEVPPLIPSFIYVKESEK